VKAESGNRRKKKRTGSQRSWGILQRSSGLMWEYCSYLSVDLAHLDGSR